MRAASDARRRWRLWLSLGVLVGLVAGGLLAAGASARRTASAYSRLVHATSAPDVIVAYAGCDPEGPDPECLADRDPELARVATLDGVEAARVIDDYTGAFGIVGGDVIQSECDTGTGEMAVLAPTTLAATGTVLRPRVLAGRAADASLIDEVTVNLAVAERGVRVGDVLRADLGEFCRVEGSAPPVPRDLRVVGIVSDTLGIRAETGGYFPAVHATAAFGRWARDRGIAHGSYAAIRLERGASIDDVLASGIALTPVIDGDMQRAGVHDGVRPDVLVLGLIAGLGLAGVLLVLLPLLVRVEQGLMSDAPALRILGFTRGDLLRLGALHGLGVGAVAVPVALVVALALSPLSPVAEAHAFEVSPGLDVDATLLAPGVVALVALLGGVGAVAAAMAGRRQRTAPTRPSFPVRIAASMRARPVATLGLRLAFEGAGGRAASSTGRLAAQVLAVAALVGALTFSAGLDHLGQTPRLVGASWDAMVFPSGDLVAALADDPDIERATAGTYFVPNGAELFKVGEEQMTSWVMSLRGGADEVGFTVISGRTPLAPGELLVHPALLDRLGLDVGDDTVVHAGGAPVSVVIVGTGVIPIDMGQFESGSAMSYEGLEVVLRGIDLTELTGQPGLQPEVVMIDFSRGVDELAKREELLEGGLVEDMFLTDSVTVGDEVASGMNLSEIAGVPNALAALGAVLAVLVLAYLVVDRVREWRRELAVHRAIGFTSAQTRHAVSVGVVALALVVAAVGIPLGVAGGRLAWLAYASGLGVKPEAVVPWAALGPVAAGVFVVALGVAAVPGWLASRRSTARLLRAE